MKLGCLHGASSLRHPLKIALSTPPLENARRASASLTPSLFWPAAGPARLHTALAGAVPLPAAARCRHPGCSPGGARLPAGGAPRLPHAPLLCVAHRIAVQPAQVAGERCVSQAVCWSAVHYLVRYACRGAGAACGAARMREGQSGRSWRSPHTMPSRRAWAMCERSQASSPSLPAWLQLRRSCGRSRG